MKYIRLIVIVGLIAHLLAYGAEPTRSGSEMAPAFPSTFFPKKQPTAPTSPGAPPLTSTQEETKSVATALPAAASSSLSPEEIKRAAAANFDPVETQKMWEAVYHDIKKLKKNHSILLYFF